MQNTKDIFNIFYKKYANGEIRRIGNETQQSNTVEIQNAHFEVDKPWIIREPNNDYFKRELDWYYSQSLNVYNIEGVPPYQWRQCADKDGFINSNYGWCIFSEENGSQYRNCKKKLIEDPHTREAIMIYNRPSMQYEFNSNGMHDFMCCQNVQYFINDVDSETDRLDCIVNFRSCDAVFGFNNDALWEQHILDKLTNELKDYWKIKYKKDLQIGKMYWNAGSLHIYERHFDILANEETKKNIYKFYDKNRTE